MMSSRVNARLVWVAAIGMTTFPLSSRRGRRAVDRNAIGASEQLDGVNGAVGYLFAFGHQLHPLQDMQPRQRAFRSDELLLLIQRLAGDGPPDLDRGFEISL